MDPATAAVAAAFALSVAGDAIAQPLAGAVGDAERGRDIVASRQVGLCLLCHSGPFPEERFQGAIGPDLRGTGARLTPGQIRLRIADPARLNPDTVMPSYYKVEGLARVAPAYRGKPILSAQQIEDVVSYLATLK
jgi:sulfur-oxidizing protein SoxX